MIKIRQYTNLSVVPNYNRTVLTMRTKIIILLYLCFSNIIVFSEENAHFYPPTLSPEKIIQIAEWHTKKEQVNLDEYKLTAVIYDLGNRDWFLEYTLYSNNEPLMKFLNITIKDEYPCVYDIDQR